jgi:hypothetical protein
MRSIPDVWTNIETIRAATLFRLEPLTQEQLDWTPPDGEWSLGEIFMHLAIDEHYLREQIARPLLEGVQPPEDVTFLPPPPPRGASKAVIEYWFERARIITHRLFEDWPADANLELKHVGGLELMNGLEWLEGYGGHEAFHQRHLDRVIAQLAAAVSVDTSLQDSDPHHSPYPG